MFIIFLIFERLKFSMLKILKIFFKIVVKHPIIYIVHELVDELMISCYMYMK